VSWAHYIRGFEELIRVDTEFTWTVGGCLLEARDENGDGILTIAIFGPTTSQLSFDDRSLLGTGLRESSWSFSRCLIRTEVFSGHFHTSIDVHCISRRGCGLMVGNRGVSA
jgi:hypothetical protein